LFYIMLHAVSQRSSQPKGKVYCQPPMADVALNVLNIRVVHNRPVSIF